MSQRKRKGDWVVMGGKPGEVAYCTRCGEGLTLSLPQHMDVFIAASNAFIKVHSRCEKNAYFEKPAVTPEEWAAGRDTGTSSLTIYSAITGKPTHHRGFDIPYDPDDFGRCYRLLKLFPAWREKLGETIKRCPPWKPFVEAWDELTALYELEVPNHSGSAPRLYARMKELEKIAREPQKP